MNLIKEINHKYGITVVVITHEMSVIQEICHKCLVLEDGKLVEENTVEELFRHPKTQAAKRLIFSASNSVKKMEGGRVLRVSFSELATYEPVIANLILEFKTPVNILSSDVTSVNGKTKGQMIIQLPDDETKASKMIEYLSKKEELSITEVSNG